MNKLAPAEPEIAAALQPFANYDGTTYYGRRQLKPWPFNAEVVGAYIFLAGLSGSSQILATVAATTGREDLVGVVRRGRSLALFAPTVGAVLLVYDLHTPKRFYNMLRVAKATSPMSIGTWILMSFSGASFTAAAGQAGADLWPSQRWMGSLSRAAGWPAALAGAGLCTYTAALLSATSTPVWAAAPSTLAIRFGSSSIATGAAALALGEKDPDTRAKLDDVQLCALAVEAALSVFTVGDARRSGVEKAYASASGRVEQIGATALGVLLPLGILAASRLAKTRPRAASVAAGVLTLLGGATLRSSTLRLGNVSASRPDVSFRFSTPRNLPEARG